METPIPIHILYQGLIFLAVMTVLSRLVFKPILKIFAERERRITGDREEARDLVKKAETRVQEYEDKIYQAKTEAKDIKLQILSEASKKEREILTEARNQATAIIAQGRDRMAQEARDMLPQIKKEAQGLAHEMAGIVLGRRISIVIFLFIFPTVAFAEAGGHHSVPSWGELIGPLALRYLNLAIFVAGIWFLARKVVPNFLRNRRKEIEENVNQSAERKAWAEQMYADYNRRLDSIEKEILELKKSLQEEGQKESEQLMAHARKMAQDIKRDASLVADAELDDLRNQLRKDAIETAAMVARETILGNINKDDQDRLTNEFVDELKNAEKLQ